VTGRTRRVCFVMFRRVSSSSEILGRRRAGSRALLKLPLSALPGARSDRLSTAMTYDPLGTGGIDHSGGGVDCVFVTPDLGDVTCPAMIADADHEPRFFCVDESPHSSSDRMLWAPSA
jgi:hypothetical protein